MISSVLASKQTDDLIYPNIAATRGQKHTGIEKNIQFYLCLVKCQTMYPYISGVTENDSKSSNQIICETKHVTQVYWDLAAILAGGIPMPLVLR